MKVFKEGLILTFAIFIVAISVYFFLIPSQTSISSIAGLSIVLSKFIPFKVSEITFTINVFLLAIGVKICGKEFGLKTCYTALIMPVFLWIFEIVFPNFQSFTNDQFLDVVCYVFVVSIGLTILFNRNASSGGLDIIAKIINKYFNIDIGKALTVSGLCVAFTSIFAFNSKSLILSILGTYLNGLILDQFIFERTLKRRVCIMSKKEDEIRKFIVNDLKSGATIYKVVGAYTLEEHNEIITIVDRSEYQRLMNYIKMVDPQAFIAVYKVTNMQYKPKNIM
ncbi:MAG: YitT family protein [Erysipelotrichaceae bacterium]|nr:YitT family protein [Erysipelotrichaceae bacterium]